MGVGDMRMTAVRTVVSSRPGNRRLLGPDHAESRTPCDMRLAFAHWQTRVVDGHEASSHDQRRVDDGFVVRSAASRRW